MVMKGMKQEQWDGIEGELKFSFYCPVNILSK